MAKTWSNPLAFRPLPVTIISSLVYCALFVSLLVAHHQIPSAPSNPVPYTGTNITEAWFDLKVLTNGYHPYNSRRNDVVRNWLLQRLDEILESNNASFSIDTTKAHNPNNRVTIFNDNQSNLTFSAGQTSTYFEGTNIIVYVRGTNDGPDGWRTTKRSGVMVNAHYDSVSTGFGATDDGVGVVTVLQLIRYFSHPDHQPKRGLVALLNNGEEDFLNGARAFARHPISSFPHTFLNLEGAGAGGKAALFRSTDTEVTRFYKGTQSPYGTVVSGDAFNRGAIRSQTDYVVFNGELGMRGLDVAFFEPRARYHTDQDDTRHTSIDSLWHMLSASIHTLQGLTEDTSSNFDGKSAGQGKVSSGTGSGAVWFDVYGKIFFIFQLHTLFAMAVILLVISPILVLITIAALIKADKLYLFSLSARPNKTIGSLRVSTGGLRGLFRFPMIIAFSSAGVGGLAFLVTKLNPFIIYSSPYSVWAMMISAWIFLSWFLSRAIDSLRPSAFQRSYALLWLYVGNWILLIIETVYEESLGIAGGYPIVACFAAVSLATFMNLLEQFGLETKDEYAKKYGQDGSEEALYREPRQSNTEANQEDEPTESTSLLTGVKRTTFAKYSSSGRRQTVTQDTESVHDETSDSPGVFRHEQLWSENLPSWLWILQLLVLIPIPVILIGQIGLLLSSAMNQSLADGNPALTVYLAISVLTVFIMVPIGPFLHRFTYHLPTALALVLVGTTIYNTFAFPFSGNNRLKVSFIQRVDLDSGLDSVALLSPSKKYLQQIVETLPSAAGQRLQFAKSMVRRDQIEAIWTGIPPAVVPSIELGVPTSIGYSQWIDFNITHDTKHKSASIVLYGRNTRSCRLLFDNPVGKFEVQGSDYDPRMPAGSAKGTKEIRLWSREWERPWNVTFQWKDQLGVNGKVVCLWNDEDGQRLIPALEEVRRFAPDWVAVTKASDGLVEGSKAFSI